MRGYAVFVFHVERVVGACLSVFLSFFLSSLARVRVVKMGRVGLFLGWVLGLILDGGWIYIGRCVNLYRLRCEAI